LGIGQALEGMSLAYEIFTDLSLAYGLSKILFLKITKKYEFFSRKCNTIKKILSSK
jgi:hypothetical protein